MKIIEAVSTIKTILQRSKVNKDTRITNSFILSRIKDYRSVEIRHTYAQYQEINPIVIQYMGAMDVTQSTYVDEPGFPAGSKVIGKIRIPPVVAMDEDRGVYAVYTPGKTTVYHTIDFEKFFLIPEDHIASKFCYKFRMGEQLYISKYHPNVDVYLILDDFMEGFVIDATYKQSGQLIPATEYRPAVNYTVESGGIVHNGISYNQGQTFDAVNPNFTGNGKVRNTIRKRPIDMEDNIPMPRQMFEAIAMKIWTKDFGLEAREIADIKNDGSDQVVVNQNES